jgi:hypothetical protein
MESWQTEKMPKDGFTPFSSNVVTYKERALLPFGAYTVSQNTRDYRPGLKKRPGLAQMDSYGYLGPTIDIRPGHDDGSTPVILAGCFYSNDAYATLALARSNIDDFSVLAESNVGRQAPGVRTDDWDADYGVGRVWSLHNIKRLSFITNITSASLFILLTDDLDLEGPDFGIVVSAATAGSEALPCSTDTRDDTNYVLNYLGTPLTDRISLTRASYGEDFIVELPFNSDGINYLNEKLVANSGDGEVHLIQLEYDVDFSDDPFGLPSGHLDGDHEVEQRVDRYFPFLRITYDTPYPPAVISMFQYNQMRSGDQETLAYYNNGDILSSYQEPPTPRSDVRDDGPHTILGGDNSGKHPYSDGTPSSDKGDLAMRNLAPDYDSKWGKFIYRDGGLNLNNDWDHCHTGTTLLNDPPSWAVLDDVLIVATGRTGDYAKFYGGENGQPCKASLVVYNPSGADTGIFRDDWDENGIIVTCPTAWTSSSYFYLYTPIPTNEFVVDVTLANIGVGAIRPAYWTGSGWTEPTTLNIEDGTAVAGVTMKQDGTLFADGLEGCVSQRLHGISGYWYRFRTTDSADRFTAKFKAKYSFQELDNVWDGILVDAIEAKVWDASVGASGTYYTYANTAIDVSGMVAADYVYFSCFDIPKQIYIDVGSTPNDNGIATTPSFQYWDGDSWNAWSFIADNTNGLTSTGFVQMSSASSSQKQPFQGSLFASHWFRMSFNQTLGTDMRISIQYEPTLSLTDFGSKTNCCAVWKERAIYSFDKYPSWIYVTANGSFNVLNGDDYAVLQAGDGRRHKVVAMRKFHNELMVWQEEKGMEGGCLTLFEGYSPATFGKLLLSSKIGTLNAQSVVVVDGALEASRTDYQAATIAYFLSNYGVFMSDGQTVVSISAAIQNYFDPDHSDCIRNGYQNMCWLVHDPTHQVLRMGIVSGSSAVEPNIFPVYDLITKRWSFDAYATKHTIRCMAETSGGSESAVQVAVVAGAKDGHIYHASSDNLNDGGDTAIDMQVRIELNDFGKLMELNELAVRLKKQAAGNCLFTVYENGVLNTEHSKTVDMTAGDASEENVVDRLILGVYQEDMISIAFQNATINQDMYLYDFWIDAATTKNR